MLVLFSCRKITHFPEKQPKLLKKPKKAATSNDGRLPCSLHRRVLVVFVCESYCTPIIIVSIIFMDIILIKQEKIHRGIP